MHSYEKRLQSFKDWPKEHNHFFKRLAVAGQYSLDAATWTTKCFYCNKEHSGWNPTESPYIEHMRQCGSNKCPIFKLRYSACRKELAKGVSLHPDKEDLLLNKKFIFQTISKYEVFFCMVCGSSDTSHYCEKPVHMVTLNTNTATAQFYVRYFNGDFVNELDMYLGNQVDLDEKQLEMAKSLMEQVKVQNVFMTVDEFLEECTNKIYQDLDKKMKSIENDAINGIYNESMIL